MKTRAIVATFTVLLLGSAQAAQDTPQFSQAMISAAERSNYERTSTFAEVVAVIAALESKSGLIHRETLLTTDDGKVVPILVLADPPISTPEQAQASGKPIIYIQGNIHGGEVEGKEAALIVMRDILFGDKQHLLDNQILVFVPIYNADGNDDMSYNSRPSQELSPALTGVRHAHGYDLNRDGMIAEAPETQALLENVIRRWDPDLLVDLHTTNGTWHGYSLTYAPSYHTAGDPATSEYTADIMLPAIAQTVKEKFNLDFGWYGSFDYRDWPPTELRTYHHAPRYLTNQMALRNRMAILSETFAHDRFYKRVHAANVFVEEILEYTHEHGYDIRRINREADARSANAVAGLDNGVQFEMRALDEPLNLLSYKYIPYANDQGETHFVRSAEIVEIPQVLNFNRFEAIKQAVMPEAYVFPAQLSALAAQLQLHGVEVRRLGQASEFNGQVFRVSEVAKQAYELNDHSNSLLAGEYAEATRSFSGDDYYVAMDTRLANLIFYLLEPQADDGLAFWNLFDDYLAQQLQQNPDAAVEYPIFKVLPQ